MKNSFKDPQMVQFLKTLNKKEIGMIKSIEESSIRNMMAMPPKKLIFELQRNFLQYYNMEFDSGEGRTAEAAAKRYDELCRKWNIG